MRRGAIEIGPDEWEFIDYLNLLAEKKGLPEDTETPDLSQLTTRGRAALRAL